MCHPTLLPSGKPKVRTGKSGIIKTRRCGEVLRQRRKPIMSGKSVRKARNGKSGIIKARLCVI